MLSNLRKLNGREGTLLVHALFWVFLLSTLSASAQTFSSLASFNYTDGATPFGLVQGVDGNFYGPTDKGGTGGNNGCNTSCGSVFKMTPLGTLTSAFGFDGTDGNGPTSLVQAGNGTFYGTTSYGGGTTTCTTTNAPCGTIFKLVGKTLTTLYTFCLQNNCTDGSNPWGAMVIGTDGNLYGTTASGGTGGCTNALANGCGTVFKLTVGATPKLTVLHSFVGTDGEYPFGSLMQATNGSFYGTTSVGGASGYGTIFKITSAGVFALVHSFTSTDGAYPYGGLVQGTDGNFYGLTSEISLNGGPPDCKLTGVGYGTFFKLVASSDKLTTLFTFNNTDGAYPDDTLTLGSDGNFYGTTSCGGTNNDGTAFELTPAGALTTLHQFAGSDGDIPYAGVIQGTNGEFYGTTILGGTDSDGTGFSIATGLTAFVVTRPTSGNVGSTVYILGNKLSGATAVAFNGKTATFKVLSGGSEIKATVPTGATTGTVTVTTPTGTLKSNVPFRIP